MMLVGDKIRGIRLLKGLSQENMAEMLSMSLVAYGDIERNKTKELTLKRLEQIAQVLGVTVPDILSFGDRISNFFENCQNTNVLNGENASNITHYNDSKEIQHQLQIAQLEIEKLKLEKEKMQWELRYWQEKMEKEEKTNVF